jgi:ADP-ribose pyrophosphatase
MKPWKTLSQETLLNFSEFLSIEKHTVELPDGRVIDDWPWLVTPDYVNVAAVTHDKKFLCFRQTKYGVKGTTLAPAGGYIEPGEDPLIAAQRELLEETGYEASHWTPLGTYVVDGNRGAGTAYLFLAQNAVHVTTPHADDLEEQELLLLTRTEIETALADGEFKVLAWPAVMALALLHLKSTE